MSPAPVDKIATAKAKPAGWPRHHQTGSRHFMHLKKASPLGQLLTVLAALAVLGAAALHAAPIRTVTATITRITDGDTVQAITAEGTKLKVRLYGIDAPETQKGNKPGEPFGNASKDYLASLVSRRSIRVEILDIDRYRRMVAILWLAERNVNQEMIAAGMAEAYVEYLKKPYRAPFIQAEQEAKAQGRGVWSQGSRYERPSQFRKRMGS